jgi:quinol-cytochrome oxidoreductase complex cytochrome b subunit
MRMERLARDEARAAGWRTRRRFTALGDWFDDRTNYRKLLREGLYEAVPVRGAWWYSLGSATLILILLQLATGIFLLFQYVPSTSEALASLRWVKEHDAFGAAVRALHLWGAYVLMFVIGLHMVRTFTSGSYKRPRELNWLTGVVLFLLVLGLAITGAFLPWDEAAYWTAVVVTNVPAYIPLVGDWVRTLWRGGDFVGPVTLSRTFGIHVWLLPGALFTLILVHLALLRKHGEFGSWVNYRGSWRSRPPGEEPPAARRDAEPPYPSAPADEEWSVPLETQDFYPHQTFRDGVVSAALVLVVVGLALTIGAPLESGPDPATTSYTPVPEWFFLPLDQLLVLAPRQLIGLSVLLPALGVLFLAAVPWLDRGPERDPFQRAVVILPAAVIVFLILTLTLLGSGRLFNL